MSVTAALSAEEAARLWSQFRDGNGDALGKLIGHYYQDLFAYGTRFSPNTDIIKDCIQEICLELWKNRAKLGETAYVKFYLLKSLRRRLIRELQKQQSEPLDETAFHAGFGPELPLEQTMIRDEQIKSLALKMRKLLNSLSKRQQEVIYLRFYMEVDMEEIAAIMGINRQSAYNHLHDALKRLKALAGSLHMAIYLLLYRP